MINIVTSSSTENNIYLSGDNTISLKGSGPVLGINNPYRPALVSEVVNVLKDRKNHITERVYLKDDKLYLERLDGDETLLSDLSREATSDERNDLNNLHYNLGIQETTLVTSSEITFDLIKNSAVIDLIEEDEYTSCVGIDKIRMFARKPGVSAKIDLSVKYTSENKDVIGCEDLTFKAFEYDSDANLITKDFSIDLECGIRVEFIDGIIRLIPINESVKECIISNCVVSYGKLKH